MKKLKGFLASFILIVTIFICSGCGEMSIDYDLVSAGNQVAYTTIMKMEESPKKYINKTFKVRGKMGSNGNSYHYITVYDNAACCTSSPLEIDTVSDDIEYPKTSKNVIVIGTYKSRKVGGKTAYYLEVSEFA